MLSVNIIELCSDYLVCWLWIFRFRGVVPQVSGGLFVFEQGCGCVFVSLNWNHLNSHESSGVP